MKSLCIVALVCAAALAAVTPKQLWNYTTQNCVASTVVVGGGLAITGTDGDRLVALDATTGKLKWAYTASMWIQNNPIIVNNTVIVPNNNGNVDAVDLMTGKLVWRYTGASEYNGQQALVGSVKNTPALFIGGATGEFNAISLEKGTQLWSTNAGGEIFASAVFIDTEQTKLVFGTYSGTVNCLDTQTGAAVWTTTVTTGGLFTPFVSGGHIYIGSQEPGGQFILDSTTGKLLWSNTNVPDVVGQPFADSERVYWTLNNGSVVATDFNGKPQWWYTVGGTQLNSAPVLNGGVLYIGGYHGLYALNPADGSLQWHFEAPGYAAQLGAPTISAGTAYFGTCLGTPSGVFAVSFGSGSINEWLCDDATCQHGCSVTPVALGCEQQSTTSSIYRNASATELTVTQYFASATCDQNTPSVVTNYAANVCNVIPTGGSFVWAPSS